MATTAVEAYAGVRTAMRGGDAAAVTTAMAKTGLGAYIAGAVASGYRTVVDTESAVSVFSNPYASPMDKLNAVTDVAEDVVGFFGSVKMAVDSFRILFSSNDYNALCSRHKTSDDADITDPHWPPDGGFEENPISEILQPGTRIDRYGYDAGTYVSPEGTPYSQRSLAPGTVNKPYTVFELVKPIEVQSGKIAPWFGEEGGGIQYKFNIPISELLEQGVLKKVGQ